MIHSPEGACLYTEAGQSSGKSRDFDLDMLSFILCVITGKTLGTLLSLSIKLGANNQLPAFLQGLSESMPKRGMLNNLSPLSLTKKRKQIITKCQTPRNEEKNFGSRTLFVEGA